MAQIAGVVEKASDTCISAILEMTSARDEIPSQCLDSKRDITGILFLLDRIDPDAGPSEADLSIFSQSCQTAAQAALAPVVRPDGNDENSDETTVVPCDDDFCNGHGVATDSSTGCECLCVDGFTGDKCEESDSDVVEQANSSGLMSSSWIAMLAVLAAMYVTA